MLLVRLHIYIDLLKLKAYKLFENNGADLSWLLFLKKTICYIQIPSFDPHLECPLLILSEAHEDRAGSHMVQGT